jgi:hypothetical protein
MFANAFGMVSFRAGYLYPQFLRVLDIRAGSMGISPERVTICASAGSWTLKMNNPGLKLSHEADHARTPSGL